MQELLVLHHVTVAYTTMDGIKPVIRDLSLKIKEGEAIALIGQNGCGKSTLAHILSGLTPISRGTLKINPSIQNNIQIVFQNPDAQIIGDTVYEDVCFGLENYCVDPKDIPIRALRALSAVGLRSAANRPVEFLSGGQKQLLCIADALALDAQVIIFDEVTAMLDPLSRKAILQMVNHLLNRGKTVLWITQLLEEVGHFARVLALQSGELVFDGTPEDFFFSDHIPENTPCSKLGFVPPFSVQLAHQLLQLGVLSDERPILMTALKDAVEKQCQSI
ncbi:energy-coupling factor ABC transporter ATP-binding protein [Sulfoacidibacillus thermotolerans]|uniref:ABC transporter domain-containing protein n=1 Tax=Sulfoacidibacillus thermotolerans TaxID=1765684 RepID=A0A2U3D843_SULT2|nr:ATP-binding cassette domain-containing protein [Sulfoacidibacillus thermotolerans]PWI57447.1 hypothetical protein BM613_08205 [Sulfoacidibacillus thermotolerans]